MSSNMIKKNDSYRKWIQEVSSRFRRSQIKAAVKVNEEMLRFYWSLGRDMESQKSAYAWGSHFYQTISDDLKEAIPDVRSFSPRNLLYMHQFYKLFPNTVITPGADAQLSENPIAKQVVSQLTGSEIVKQPVSQRDARR